MSIYGNAALAAVERCVATGIGPAEAWDESIVHETTSKQSRKKRCPRCAFLGLCEEGLVRGVPSGHYLARGKSNDNKAYACEAVRLLRKDNGYSHDLSALWNAVMANLGMQAGKRQNSQMAVVLALWQKGKIRTD